MTYSTIYLGNISFIILSLIVLYFLITYTKPLNAKSLLDYFIYLTNKVILLTMFIVFAFISFLSSVTIDYDKVAILMNEYARALLYYAFFNYSVFFGLKLIMYMKEFFKEFDLFAISYIDKLTKSSNRRGKK